MLSLFIYGVHYCNQNKNYVLPDTNRNPLFWFWHVSDTVTTLLFVTIQISQQGPIIFLISRLTFQSNFIRLLLCFLTNASTNSSRFMALFLLDSTLSTPKLLKCSSVMVHLKAVLINFSIEKLHSRDAVLTGNASAILHSLNMKLFGVSWLLFHFLSRMHLSWGISYCRSSVLQLYCEANGNTTSFSQNVGPRGFRACIPFILTQFSVENLLLTSERSTSITGRNEPVWNDSFSVLTCFWTIGLNV